MKPRNNKVLLVLGATGLLGSEFLLENKLCGWSVVSLGHSKSADVQADISNFSSAFAALNKISPDAILNLVGLTDVDRCEAFPNESYLINVKAVENLTQWIKSSSKETHLIHISTDQVYDGLGEHLEDNVTLKNYYAFSKYAGELASLSIPSATVLRTNFFGKSKRVGRASFTDWLFASLREKRQIKVFDDVFFSPLYMRTLVEILGHVVENRVLGVYNLGSKSGMSKADFSYCFAEALNLDVSVMHRVGIDDSGVLKVYRPRDMRMDVSKFEAATGLELPTLKSEILKVSREYMHEA